MGWYFKVSSVLMAAEESDGETNELVAFSPATCQFLLGAWKNRQKLNRESLRDNVGAPPLSLYLVRKGFSIPRQLDKFLLNKHTSPFKQIGLGGFRFSQEKVKK